jgi:hypothetical protein
MPTQSLRATLDSLAQSFAAAVLDAIRGASLDELVGETKFARRGPGRPRGSGAKATPAATTSPVETRARISGGRLQRRSLDDIEKTLGLVLAAVKTNGMRAEELQKFLSLDKRELPRVLALGLSKKVLKKKGQKRATVYSAA